ncbi:MAG: tRNA pseudouridine(38-40) synthase TruA [Litoreibacter sp.]
MPRYAMKIEYNGAPFNGWQRQEGQPTVQGSIEAALRKLEPEFDTIAAAGRTDTGVHGSAQVAHCDMHRSWSPFRLTEALNFHLKPLPISILQTAQVADDWHARFDALERRYLFRLISRRAPLAHENGLAWRINHDLDLAAMREAANHLIGRHDFTTFRSSMCQAKSPVKTLDHLEIEAHEIPYGHEFTFRLSARSFLHNQVRSFVGSLERVGAGSWEPHRMKEVLEAKDRTKCGPVCPPQGLYLAGVGYPRDVFNPTP